MYKKLKNDFQNIHYARKKAGFALDSVLKLAAFFYKRTILLKNFLYEKEILKEEKITGVNVVCVGNLTTGGVGKTPIVVRLANKISKNSKVAIVSRGYGAKLQNKYPNVIKDFDKIYYSDGSLCGDEALFCAKNALKNVIVITCRNRIKAVEIAKEKYGCKTIILDDGFSNRTIHKDKNIIVIDSKMRFGNNNVLPLGPLREPVEELKRADKIILVDKGDKKIDDAVLWAKNISKKYNKELCLCKLAPDRVYNIQTKSDVVIRNNLVPAVAFCAIGQPEQFFEFAKKYYSVVEKVPFNDHYDYKKSDIEKLKKIAKKHNARTFITTQKDEVKLYKLLKNDFKYTFNVLQLGLEIIDID